MEFLINKTNECPRCKCENLTKENDCPEVSHRVIAKCTNCQAKFVLFTTECNENDTK